MYKSEREMTTKTTAKAAIGQTHIKYRNLLNLFYGATQGFYSMAIGALLSFSSAFLLGKSYTNSEIGLVLAVASVIAVILQPLLADIGDRSKKFFPEVITAIIIVGLGILTFTLIFSHEKTMMLSLTYVIIAAFLTSLQPLVNALAFSFGGPGARINFGITRSGGSISYAVLCTVLGVAIAHKGGNIIPFAAIPIFALMLLALALSRGFSRKIQRDGKILDMEADKMAGEKPDSKSDSETVHKAHIGFGEFMGRNKYFALFSMGIIFLFFQQAVFSSFMIQIVMPLGGGSAEAGQLLSFAAIVEIPGLIFFSRLQSKFSCRFMLKFSAAAFIFKTFLTYMAGSVGFIYVAFLFQIASFPIFLSAAVHLADEVLEKREAVKGQALVTTAMTISSVLASFTGGRILDYMGASTLLLVAGILTIIGTLIIIFAVNRIPKR